MLRSIARWMVLSTIPLSVILWGGTRPWTGEIIGWALTAAGLCFIASLLLPDSQLILEKRIVAGILLVLVPGWISILNGFHIAWLPSSIDTARSLRAVILTGGMLIALLITIDAAFSRIWRLRLWITLCITGMGMVVLGIVQRLTGAQAIYWNLSEYHGGFFFSVFRYHANAGAFMNLVLPMMAGLAARAVLKREPSKAVFWSTSLLLTFAAAFVNVSRAAEAVTLLMVVTMALFLAVRFHCRLPGSSLPWIVAFVLLSTGLIFSFGIKKSLARWRHGLPMTSLSDGSFFSKDRGLTYLSVTCHLLPRSRFLGSGPGTFEPAFASVIKEDSLPVRGRWDFAHNDYLQILTEWGVIPFLALLALLGGAVTRGFLLWHYDRHASTSLLGLCGSLALMGLLLHAIVDFPLQIPSIQLVASVISGLLLGSPSDGSQRALRVGNRT